MSRRSDRARIAQLEDLLDEKERQLVIVQGDRHDLQFDLSDLGVARDNLATRVDELTEIRIAHEQTIRGQRTTLAANAADAATAQRQLADLTARVDTLIEQSTEDQECIDGLLVIATARRGDQERLGRLLDNERQGRASDVLALQATLDDHLGLIDRLVAAGDALHASALRKSPQPRKLKPVQAWAALSASVKGDES